MGNTAERVFESAEIWKIENIKESRIAAKQLMQYQNNIVDLTLYLWSKQTKLEIIKCGKYKLSALLYLAETYSIVNYQETLLKSNVYTGRNRPYIEFAQIHLVCLQDTETKEYKSYLKKAQALDRQIQKNNKVLKKKKIEEETYKCDPLTSSEKIIAVEIYELSLQVVEILCNIIGQYSQRTIKDIFPRMNNIFDGKYRALTKEEITNYYFNNMEPIKSASQQRVIERKQKQKELEEKQERTKAKHKKFYSSTEIANWFILRSIRPSEIDKAGGTEITSPTGLPEGPGAKEIGSGGREVGSAKKAPEATTEALMMDDEIIDEVDSETKNKGYTPIGMTKLMIMMFTAQGRSLNRRGYALFKDKFIAWEFGPVIINLYNRYKNYIPIDFPGELVYKPRLSLSNLDLTVPNDPWLIDMLEQVYQEVISQSNDDICDMIKVGFAYKKAINMRGELNQNKNKSYLMRKDDIRFDFHWSE